MPNRNPSLTEEKGFYTLKRASEILGVTNKAIVYWCGTGKIDFVRTVGEHRRIPTSEVERILSFGKPPKSKPVYSSRKPPRPIMLSPEEKAEIEATYKVSVVNKMIGPSGGIKYTLKCLVCEKEIIKYKFAIKSGHGKYCSKPCYNKGCKLGISVRKGGFKHSRSKGLKYNVVNSLKTGRYKECEREGCNNTFYVTPSKEETGKGKYCCRRCFEIAHSEKMSGKKNPAYKNGSTFDKRSWRGSDWDRVRKTVYERDKWECQVCHTKCTGVREKNSGKTLVQCHHIENYTGNEVDNSIDNLITLCASCHTKIHQSKNPSHWKRVLKKIANSKQHSEIAA